MKIYLNEYGEQLYPWLAKRWISIFGYDFNKHYFLIWDDVTNEWRTIHQNQCKGSNL